MKRILSVSILVLLPLFLAAGPFQFGLKGGMNFSTLPTTVIAQGQGERLSALQDTYSGFHLGLVGSLRFPGFFIQPELLFVQTGRDMYLEFVNNPHEDDYYLLKFHHLSMPVLLGAGIGPLRLGAGPVFSLLLNQADITSLPSDIRPRLKDGTLGYQLGVGLKLGSLLLDVRYEGSLSKLGDGVSIFGSHIDFDMRPRQTIFSIGLLF
jgi:hypothetical protein